MCWHKVVGSAAVAGWVYMVAWLGPGAATGSAQPVLHIVTNYYRIPGQNLLEVHEAKSKLRPFKESAMDALTRWTITWHYHLRQVGDSWQLATISTRTLITITLPQWTVPSNAPPDDLREWKRYFSALNAHEYGHAQFGMAAAVAVRKAAQAVGSDSTFEGLKAKVEQTCNATIEEYKRKDDLYDVRTKHGATQGAVLRIRADRAFRRRKNRTPQQPLPAVAHRR